MNLVTALACACFGMPPEEINVRPAAGGNKYLFEGSRNQQIQESKEEGLYAIRYHLKTVMDMIIKRIHPELTFEWFGLSGDEDRIRKESAQKELREGGITKREYRLMTGKPAVPKGMKDADVDIFQYQAWLARKTADDQAEQQKQMAAQQPEESDYLEPGDEDYEEPDFGQGGEE